MHVIRRAIQGLVPGLAVTLLLAGSLWAQDDNAITRFGVELEAIPFPDLEVFQEAVSDSLQSARVVFKTKQAGAQTPRELADAYGRLGMHYQAHEMQDPAGAAYRNAVALIQDDARWFYYLGLHDYESGQHDAAIEHYRRVMALEPTYPAVRMRLGLAFLDSNRPGEAETVFRQLLDKDPDHAAALTGLGRVAFRAEDYANSIDYFERALVAQPQASELHYRLGMAYRQTGDLERAREHLEQRGNIKPQYPDPLIHAMQGRSQSSQFYLQQGVAAGKEGNFEGAVNALSMAIAVNPKDDAAHVALGLALEQLGQHDAAGMKYEEALRINPENAEAAFNLALLLDQRDLTEPAIPFYEQAVTNNADYTEAWYLLGHANMRLGRYARAATDFTRVAQLQLDNVHVWHLQALAFLAAGQCEDALTALATALAINPNRGDVIQTQARTFATCPSATAEQQQIALADARALYDLRPDLEHAETLAMAEAALGNYQDAADYQAQAMFESFKLGGPDKFPGLQTNMERYRDQQPAEEAWPASHPVFAPDAFAYPTESDDPS